MNQLLKLLANDLVESLLINALFQIIIITLASLALASCFRRNAAFRSSILGTGLILVLICPLGTLISQRHEIGFAKLDMSAFARLRHELEISGTPPQLIAPQNDVDSLTDSPRVASSGNLGELSNIRQTIDLSAPSPSLSKANNVAVPSKLIDRPKALTSIYSSALVLWLCGASVLLIRLFTSWLKLHRLIHATQAPSDELQRAFSIVQSRICMTARVRLRVSSQIVSPFAAGICHPVIVLPVALVHRLPGDKLAEIILHELAHIVRRDQAIVWLQHLAAAIYWPIPFVHLLNRQLAQAREEVCDNYVLGIHAATDYSRTLLSIAENFAPTRIQGAVGLFTSKWRLEQRIANLLDHRRQRSTRLRGRLALLAGILALLPSTALLVSLQWTPAIAQETSTTTPMEIRPIEELLRGTGDDLEVLLRGSVAVAPGTTLSDDIKVSITFNHSDEKSEYFADVRDGRFEAWLPVNRIPWYSVGIEIINDTGARAWQLIPYHRLRQSLVDGVSLQLKTPDRYISINTLLDGKPLPNTNVKVALFSGAKIHAKSGANGVAKIGLFESEEPRLINAWNDMGYIGGFGFFSRKPVRDPNSDTQNVEMSKCKMTRVHIRDTEGKPIANVPFYVQVNNQNGNYTGLPDKASAITDNNGDGQWKWFPSWDMPSQEVELIGDDWVITAQETTSEFQLVTVAPAFKRKRIEGYVQSDSLPVGGIRVFLSTNQSGIENRFEFLSATTDVSGRFSIDVLPDSTYCVYANDDQWVSNTIDLIPFDSKKDRVQTPYLKLSKGTPVELTFTTGKDHAPFHLNSVNMDSDYSYEYADSVTGKSRGVRDGRSVVAATDSYGKIKINAPPGPLRIAAFTADWQKEETIQVVDGQPLFYNIHRESDQKTNVHGKLEADGVDANVFVGARVFAGSRSGGYKEELETTANADGSFELTTKSSEVVIFAMSTDRKFAGSLITTELNAPLTLRMRPTVTYRGRLVDEDGKPIEGHKVKADVRFEAPEAKFHAAYRPTSMETQTTAAGEYEFKALPSEIQICFTADDFRDDDPNTMGMMEFITIDPAQNRPMPTNTIPRRKHDPSKSEKPVDERFAFALNDAKLGAYHLMVICFDRENPECQKFCNAQLIDSVHNRLVASFMHLHLNTSDEQAAGFLRKRGLSTPSNNQILAVTYNDKGDELKRQILDVTNRDAADQANDLINASAPPKQDARKKWSDAFAEAKKSNRRVWVRTSQRFCGPCLTMTRWLDKLKSVIEKDFVVFKIDTALDDNPSEFEKRLSKDRLVGIPFHAMFDADQNLIIDSYGPLGNIGCISGYDGKQHFRKMLESARINLTDDEINELLDSIVD
jgi:beta-lactamase regulating signal transducer with metallopeptidase domain